MVRDDQDVARLAPWTSHSDLRDGLTECGYGDGVPPIMGFNGVEADVAVGADGVGLVGADMGPLHPVHQLHSHLLFHHFTASWRNGRRQHTNVLPIMAIVLPSSLKS